jgi:hypothetical protein
MQLKSETLLYVGKSFLGNTNLNIGDKRYMSPRRSVLCAFSILSLKSSILNVQFSIGAITR